MQYSFKIHVTLNNYKKVVCCLGVVLFIASRYRIKLKHSQKTIDFADHATLKRLNPSIDI